MRAIRVVPVALLGAAALALTAPAVTAQAATAGGATAATGYTVTPSVVVPGGQATLAARGCSTTATASSGIFDTVTIPSGGTATATVDLDARRGAAYEVTFICNTSPSSTGRATLAISSATGTPTTSSTSAATATATAGVQGGLGGSVDTMNAAQVAGGTALAVVAATGAVYLVRRRRENRSH